MNVMRKVIVLVLVMALMSPLEVYAGDYITDAAQALEPARVYVAPDTPGTDSYTQGTLEGKLREHDNIVLVMLPPEAEDGTDLFTLVESLSDKLQNQYIIGLAVGKKVIGYAPGLPVGVAADQMRRADDVSNDPVTALITFTQNMHLWLAKNPQPAATSTPKPTSTPIPIAVGQNKFHIPGYVILLISGVAGLLLTLASIGLRRIVASRSSEDRIYFKAPGKVDNLLADIARMRTQVEDQEFSYILRQLCLHCERYFARNKDKVDDINFFTARLTDVRSVLEKYLEIQKDQYYFHEPFERMKTAKESIKGFSEYVLETIKSGNDVNLLDFKVNTNILNAQRYR
jgi:hypothetical protein